MTNFEDIKTFKPPQDNGVYVQAVVDIFDRVSGDWLLVNSVLIPISFKNGHWYSKAPKDDLHVSYDTVLDDPENPHIRIAGVRAVQIYQ